MPKRIAELESCAIFGKAIPVSMLMKKRDERERARMKSASAFFHLEFFVSFLVKQKRKSPPTKSQLKYF